MDWSSETRDIREQKGVFVFKTHFAGRPVAHQINRQAMLFVCAQGLLLSTCFSLCLNLSPHSSFYSVVPWIE